MSVSGALGICKAFSSMTWGRMLASPGLQQFTSPLGHHLQAAKHTQQSSISDGRLSGWCPASSHLLLACMIAPAVPNTGPAYGSCIPESTSKHQAMSDAPPPPKKKNC